MSGFRALRRLALTSVAVSAVAGPAGAAEVRLRANAAFAPCLAPAVEAFNRAGATRAVIDVGDPDPTQGADLVVGDDLEMTRLLEGGTADMAGARDLGTLPWVMVAPAGGTARALAAAPEPVAVMAGRAGRHAREALGGLGAVQLRVTADASEMSRARYALLPRSLAGQGTHTRADVRPLVATAAVITASPRAAAARGLLAYLAGPGGSRAIGSCLDALPRESARPALALFAQAVVDWWLPQCSLERNGYNNPQETLGPPNAVNLGGRDNFLGFMSMGQGGYVVVDMGVSAVNGPGNDLRVYQTATGEEVTVYASASPQGPFALLGLRVPCGIRTPGVFSNHCDFDLAAAGLSAARYFKIEDGEIYPCLAAGTRTEGPDIDAVEVLNAGTGQQATSRRP
jgi:hypothetical protein